MSGEQWMTPQDMQEAIDAEMSAHEQIAYQGGPMDDENFAVWSGEGGSFQLDDFGGPEHTHGQWTRRRPTQRERVDRFASKHDRKKAARRAERREQERDEKRRERIRQAQEEDTSNEAQVRYLKLAHAKSVAALEELSDNLIQYPGTPYTGATIENMAMLVKTISELAEEIRRWDLHILETNPRD